MNKGKWIIAIAVVLVVLASAVVFYQTIIKDEQSEIVADFTSDLVMPDGITITDKIDKPLVQGSNLREGEIAINDKVVVKTMLLEIGNSKLEKATKREKQKISDADRAFSIGAIYSAEAPKTGRLTTIEVLQDGTFIASKVVNGKEQFVKGKFGKYTMDFLVGLYTLR